MILTINDKSYQLQKIDPRLMITGKNYVFYGISWYELIEIKKDSVKIINIKFRGIDDFNRPVFKDVDSSTYYGSTITLYGWDEPAEKIVEHFKSNIDELEYFGSRFGCEPNGGLSKNIKLNIVE